MSGCIEKDLCAKYNSKLRIFEVQDEVLFQGYSLIEYHFHKDPPELHYVFRDTHQKVDFCGDSPEGKFLILVQPLCNNKCFPKMDLCRIPLIVPEKFTEEHRDCVKRIIAQRKLPILLSQISKFSKN